LPVELPIRWGNCHWIEEAGMLVPYVGMLPGDPEWIDYEKKAATGNSRELTEPSHPEHTHRRKLHDQILTALLSKAQPEKQRHGLFVFLHTGVLPRGRPLQLSCSKRAIHSLQPQRFI
jgi:hypothetical protein